MGTCVIFQDIMEDTNIQIIDQNSPGKTIQNLISDTNGRFHLILHNFKLTKNRMESTQQISNHQYMFTVNSHKIYQVLIAYQIPCEKKNSRIQFDFIIYKYSILYKLQVFMVKSLPESVCETILKLHHDGVKSC